MLQQVCSRCCNRCAVGVATGVHRCCNRCAVGVATGVHRCCNRPVCMNGCTVWSSMPYPPLHLVLAVCPDSSGLSALDPTALGWLHAAPVCVCEELCTESEIYNNYYKG